MSNRLSSVPKAVLIAPALALLLALTATLTRGADHRDAPLVESDGRLDINDVYVFQAPTDPSRTAMIMTLSPNAGILSPNTFHPDARYQFLIDTNGDAKEDQVYVIRFYDPDPETTLQRVRVILKGVGTIGSGITRDINDIQLANGGELHAGIFDDPFFFDLAAFQDGLDFCSSDHPGTDFFAGFNTLAIVLEVPTETFGSSTIGVWAETKTGDGKIDRMGRPAINTVFIPSDQKDAFNAGKPKKDVKDYTDELVSTLLALGNDQATAESLAAFLLPDILTIDTSSPSSFPNGRKLADDVIDIELGLISGGAITTDCVDGNDGPFWDLFPYLGPVH